MISSGSCAMSCALQVVLHNVIGSDYILKPHISVFTTLFEPILGKVIVPLILKQQVTE